MSERVQLPEYVEPTHYDLEIETNLSGTFDFQARVQVSLTLKKAGLTKITLHSKELLIKSATYSAAGAKPIALSRIEYDLSDTTVALSFASELPEGEGVLSVDYQGNHNTQMAGFYRSSYTDAQGRKKTMVSTQFEAIDARRCLPCVDEPQRKAAFKATLVVDAHLTAFSNMPEEKSEMLEGGARRRVSFMVSPKMSTYLLAFCVGEFDFVQALSEHGVLVRVYTPPLKSKLGTFALEVATKSLDLYDDMFGQPYPLPKLDMVAIPEFAMGAMENWGLVTYREVDLLIDHAKASNAQKERVCTVVTHELAHQWFGNLVTMAWWDDLWLNEGFASWMQNYAADKVFPDWKMWEQYVVDTQAPALRLDAQRSSHPIQVPINRAEEVEQVFDAISYLKGSSVVRLIHAYLGADAFESGLRTYMKRHAYSNTETVDLWQAWAEASGKPVAEFMRSWTEQMGFPVLVVEEFNPESGSARLRQEWFLGDGSAIAESERKSWSIPLFAVTPETATLPAPPLVSTLTDATSSVVLPARAAFVKLNAGQHVPMRVQYPEAMLAPLISVGLGGAKLPPVDRVGLLLDTYALVKAGRADAAVLVRLLAACKDDRDTTVWAAVEGVLSGLHKVLLDDAELSAAFTAFAAKLIAGVAKDVGWEPRADDGHLGTLLRACIIRLQGKFTASGGGAAAEEAKRRFDVFIAGPNSPGAEAALPSDYRIPVFQMVLKGGGAEEYEAILGILATSETAAEKKLVYSSLGSAPDPSLKLRTLEWAVSGKVKLQDFFYPMGGVAGSSSEGMELAWRFLQDNFDHIWGMVKNASPSLMGAVISFCAGGFASRARADEIEAFFGSHPLPLLTRKIAQVVEAVRTNAAFFERVKASEGFVGALEGR